VPYYVPFIDVVELLIVYLCILQVIVLTTAVETIIIIKLVEQIATSSLFLETILYYGITGVYCRQKKLCTYSHSTIVHGIYIENPMWGNNNRKKYKDIIYIVTCSTWLL